MRKKNCNRFCVSLSQADSFTSVASCSRARSLLLHRSENNTFLFCWRFFLVLLLFLSSQAMLANGMCERHWRSNITFAVKIRKLQNARCRARTAKKSGERSRYFNIERSLETSALLRWYRLHATMQWQCLLEARTKQKRTSDSHATKGGPAPSCDSISGCNAQCLIFHFVRYEGHIARNQHVTGLRCASTIHTQSISSTRQREAASKKKPIQSIN